MNLNLSLYSIFLLCIFGATAQNVRPHRKITLAERFATKYDAQARAQRYSTGHGYQKVSRKSYRHYYKDLHTPRR